MIALLEAHKAGLLSPKNWGHNVIAGIIVGVVAMPLAMAFAIASGATPQQGLFTSIIAGSCGAIFGGSRLQVTGPTGAFVVILAGITAKYGMQGLQIATGMAGIMLVAMGLAKLGGVIKFIPDSVIVGFTAGIGTVIFVGQWKDFFGLPVTQGAHFHEKFLHLVQSFVHLDPTTTALGVFSLLLLLVLPRLRLLKNKSRLVQFIKHIPAPLIALVLATVIQSIFRFSTVATIGSTYGGISRSLPSFEMLPLSLTTIVQLIGPAFAIALLGSIESLLSAVVADGMSDTRHDSNQELVGQGIANIVSPLFGGFAATGALARTATNIRNGATSPLASLVHCLTILAIILVAAPLAYNIPLCSLASILFVVAWNMSEVPHVLGVLRKAPKTDIGILAITFMLTVFVDLVTAVYIGVIVSSLFFMKRMASSVKVHRNTYTTISEEFQAQGIESIPPEVLVYSIDGPLFFGATETFERALAQTNTEPQIVIFRFSRVPYIDLSGLQAFEDAIKLFKRKQITVLLCEVSTSVTVKLQKAGILNSIGENSTFITLHQALEKSRRLVG